MKFDLNTVVLDQRSLQMIEQSGGKPPTKLDTLGQSISQLLLAQLPGDQTTPEEKVKRYALLNRILDAKNGIIDLQLDDLEMVKKIVDQHCPVLVHGRILAILNAPKSEK